MIQVFELKLFQILLYLRDRKNIRNFYLVWNSFGVEKEILKW